MTTVEVGDKTTPTPLLEGDLVYLGTGKVVWEVVYLSDPTIGSIHGKRNQLGRNGIPRYFSWSQVQAGKLRRADGSPIEEAQRCPERSPKSS